jgi:hypothetical protein
MPATSSSLDSLPGTSEVRAWIDGASQPRVSVYMSLPHASSDAEHQRQRDQLARDLERKIGALGIDGAPWAKRLRGVEVDARQLDPRVATLAIFADTQSQRVVPLRAALPQRLVVGDAFALRPLLGVLVRSSRYRLLVVSAHRVALFDGGPNGLAPSPHPGVPKSLSDLLGSETTEKELRMRGTRSGGGAPAVYSHGGGHDERKLDLDRFHGALAAVLDPLLPDDGIPLVLASTEEHHAALRKTAKLPGLLDAFVRGNADALTPLELHERAWPIVAYECAARAESVAESYESARDRGKGRDLLDDVAAAAVTGRVRRLWVDAERRVELRVDRTSGRTSPGTETDDALDAIVELVLAHGGEVIPVAASALPSASGLAAQLH